MDHDPDYEYRGPYTTIPSTYPSGIASAMPSGIASAMPSAPPAIMPAGCIMCGQSRLISYRTFPCNCHLPIHDSCVNHWKQLAYQKQCPGCRYLWPIQIQTPSRPMCLKRSLLLLCVFCIVFCGFLIWFGFYLAAKFASI